MRLHRKSAHPRTGRATILVELIWTAKAWSRPVWQPPAICGLDRPQKIDGSQCQEGWTLGSGPKPQTEGHGCSDPPTTFSRLLR